MSESIGTVEVLQKKFDKWLLGYQWVTASIGGASSVGLFLYAEKQKDGRFNQVGFKRVVFSLKEAIGFFADHRVPARSTAKLLRAAEADSKSETRWFAGS